MADVYLMWHIVLTQRRSQTFSLFLGRDVTLQRGKRVSTVIKNQVSEKVDCVGVFHHLSTKEE